MSIKFDSDGLSRTLQYHLNRFVSVQFVNSRPPSSPSYLDVFEAAHERQLVHTNTHFLHDNYDLMTGRHLYLPLRPPPPHSPPLLPPPTLFSNDRLKNRHHTTWISNCPVFLMSEYLFPSFSIYSSSSSFSPTSNVSSHSSDNRIKPLSDLKSFPPYHRSSRLWNHSVWISFFSPVFPHSWNHWRIVLFFLFPSSSYASWTPTH